MLSQTNDHQGTIHPEPPPLLGFTASMQPTGEALFHWTLGVLFKPTQTAHAAQAEYRCITACNISFIKAANPQPSIPANPIGCPKCLMAIHNPILRDEFTEYGIIKLTKLEAIRLKNNQKAAPGAIVEFESQLQPARSFTKQLPWPSSSKPDQEATDQPGCDQTRSGGKPPSHCNSYNVLGTNYSMFEDGSIWYIRAKRSIKIGQMEDDNGNPRGGYPNFQELQKMSEAEFQEHEMVNWPISYLTRMKVNPIHLPDIFEAMRMHMKMLRRDLILTSRYYFEKAKKEGNPDLKQVFNNYALKVVKHTASLNTDLPTYQPPPDWPTIYHIIYTETKLHDDPFVYTEEDDYDEKDD